MLAKFDLQLPGSLDEALGMLAANKDGSSVPMAGGTNVILELRTHHNIPEQIIQLDKLSELRSITLEGGSVRLGARATVTDIMESAIISEDGALKEAANIFAGQMVRNAATVAGNIGCCSPAADLVPPLMALDAEVELTSSTGTRTVALSDYFTGYKQDVRNADELITSVSFAQPADNSANLFYKLARRKGDAITVVGVAVNLSIEGGKCTKARIVLGAVAPTVIRASKAEAMLEGQALTPELIERAALQAQSEASPIDDVRASAEYRQHCVHVLVRRLVTNAWSKIA